MKFVARRWIVGLVAVAGLVLVTPRIAAALPAERPAGKLAWAELLTSGHPADAVAFYQEVFGWRAEVVGAGYEARVTFFIAGRPVAGIAHRQAEVVGPARARWVLFFAAEEIAVATEAAQAREGRLLVPADPAVPATERRVLLADPEGAVFGLVSATPGLEEEYAAEPGEWTWPLLLVRRPELTVNFYRDVLGHAVHEEARTPLFSGDFVLASGPRARAGAMALPRGSAGRPGWLGLVRVSDLDATVRAVREQGGEVVRAPTEDLIGGRIAVVSDPFGGVFGLVQLKPATGPRAPASAPATTPTARPRL